jgi:uncharacterized protein
LKIQNQYIIPLSGQKEGQHNFEFEIQNEFFEEFPVIEAKEGNLSAKVTLDKKSTFLSFDVAIKGQIKLQCDRCLDYYFQQIDYNGKFYAKYSETPENEVPSDDVIFIHPDDHELDLKQYFYESTSLSIPYKRVHPEINGKPACNKEMLKYIKNLPEKDKKDETNPIWDKLRDLNI